jgi:hypothetical protein
MKLLVLTASIGDRPFSKYTIDSMQKYAKRIGAEFKCVTEFQRDSRYDVIKFTGKRQSVFIDKLLLIQREIDQYDRIIWMDDTCVVAHDTPNLFKIVPYELFGAHNEGILSWVTCAKSTIKRYENTSFKDIITSQSYFNAGLMVISGAHRNLFDDDLIIQLGKNGHMYDAYVDQTYLNLLVKNYNVPFFALPSIFNRMAVNVAQIKGKRVNYDNYEPIETAVAIKLENFDFLNEENTTVGANNGAFIYHITSIYDTDQRYKLIKKLYEIKVDK